jgi:hypothetical protein
MVLFCSPGEVIDPLIVGAAFDRWQLTTPLLRSLTGRVHVRWRVFSSFSHDSKGPRDASAELIRGILNWGCANC